MKKNSGKKKKFGLISRLQYRFDLAMSKGMKSMIGILLTTAICFSLVFGITLGLSSKDISIRSFLLSFSTLFFVALTIFKYFSLGLFKIV